MVRPADAVEIGRRAEAELAADGDLAHRLGFLGQESSPHASGIEHHNDMPLVELRWRDADLLPLAAD